MLGERGAKRSGDISGIIAPVLSIGAPSRSRTERGIAGGMGSGWTKHRGMKKKLAVVAGMRRSGIGESTVPGLNMVAKKVVSADRHRLAAPMNIVLTETSGIGELLEPEPDSLATCHINLFARACLRYALFNAAWGRRGAGGG